MSVTKEDVTTRRLRLRMLGSPAVTREDGEAVSGLGPGKPLALLCYIARAGESRREQLTALLWGDVDEARARNAFRQSLHRLRQALGGILVQQQDRLSIAGPDTLWCDVTAFEEAIARKDLDSAVELYGGEFLEGFVLGEPAFDQWVDLERARLHTQFQTALDAGARAAIAQADWATAAARAARLVEVAPYEAGAALLLASALEGGGRGREAVASLAAFVARCEEIGVAAPPEIEERLSRRAPGSAERARISGVEIPEQTVPGVFVGRTAAMERLNQAWSRVLGGQGATLLVTGETGSGKSRILNEFAAAVSVLDDPVLLRGGESRGAALPYASVAEALRGAIRAPGLAGASEHLLAEAARIVPEIRDRFKLPPSAPVEDDAARLRFFEGIAAVLEAISYEQPVCILLDSMEHSAPATLDLVYYLSARLRGSAVLIGCAGSPRTFDRFGDAGRAGAAEQSGSIVRVELEPLAEEDALALVSALPVAADLTDDDRVRIVRMGNGNPLRLIELARQVASGVPLSAPLITLNEILTERLQSQPATHRRLFLAAALFGRPVQLRLLAAAAHLSEPATLDAALDLEEAGLLLQSADGVAPAHALVAELAIEQAGAAGASLIAGWAADALAADQPARYAELAELYARAGRAPEAYRCARRAAEEALRVGAFREASALLERALQFAPDDAARSEVQLRLDALGAGARRLPAAASGGNAAAAGAPAAPWYRSRWLISAVLVAGVVSIALSLARSARLRPVGHVLADTVLLVETESPGDNRFFSVTGQLAAAATSLVPAEGAVPGPQWVDSVRVPWMNPRVSPDGEFVALERMTELGPDLFLIRSDRADTIAVATAGGDDFALDWAPDGSALLVSRSRTRADDSYDTDLYLFRLADRSLLPVDTMSAREIADASWSPAGTYILWTARVVALGQQEIYVSRPDGSAKTNISGHPAEDYRPAWAPDGTRIVFTSDRDGDPELYSAEIPGGALARLTWNDAQDDRAVFSPDGRFIAFESTRGGSTGVYVMASRGGQPARVSPPSRRMSLAGWRSESVPYVDRLRLVQASPIEPGDSVQSEIEAVMSDGTVRLLEGAALAPLDDRVTVRVRPADGVVLTGVAPGVSRMLATLPGWRSDTLFVKVGDDPVVVLADDFDHSGQPAADWTALGSPGPKFLPAPSGGDGNMLVPASMRGGQSGLLSAQAFPAAFGLSLRARMLAPFSRSTAASLVLALVNPPAIQRMDASAPAFLPLASVSWLGDARRIAYAVDREVKTEPVSALGSASAHDLEIRVENDGHVAFFVDGTLRWRSTLRLASAGSVTHVDVWVAGQTSRADTGFDSVQLWVGETVDR